MTNQQDPDATQVFSNFPGSIPNRTSRQVTFHEASNCTGASAAETFRHEVPEGWPKSVANGPITVLPPGEDTQFSMTRPYRPTLATRILRNTAYVVVIVTCLYFMITMFHMNQAVDEFQEILRDWADGFAGNLFQEI